MLSYIATRCSLAVFSGQRWFIKLTENVSDIRMFELDVLLPANG